MKQKSKKFVKKPAQLASSLDGDVKQYQNASNRGLDAYLIFLALAWVLIRSWVLMQGGIHIIASILQSNHKYRSQ